MLFVVLGLLSSLQSCSVECRHLFDGHCAAMPDRCVLVLSCHAVHRRGVECSLLQPLRPPSRPLPPLVVNQRPAQGEFQLDRLWHNLHMPCLRCGLCALCMAVYGFFIAAVVSHTHCKVSTCLALGTVSEAIVGYSRLAWNNPTYRSDLCARLCC